jgi:hypothetical protein
MLGAAEDCGTRNHWRHNRRQGKHATGIGPLNIAQNSTSDQAHLDLDLQPHRRLLLFLEGIRDRLHRGLKEFCDVFSVQAFQGQ